MPLLVSIVEVQNRGNAANERVVLEATGDCDIGFHVVADCTYNPDRSVSNKLRHCYLFPKQMITTGDRVVLHTGIGVDYTSPLNANNTTYHYYWNLGVAVWNDAGDGVLVLRYTDWGTKVVP